VAIVLTRTVYHVRRSSAIRWLLFRFGVLLRSAPARSLENAHQLPLDMKLIVRWLLAACALLLVAYIYPGVQFQGYGSALIAAAVIGLFNVLLRPILVILTLPVTVVTLGLFLFVINALLFWAASGILAGFGVNGFWAAMLGSVIYSVLMLGVDAAIRSIFPV